MLNLHLFSYFMLSTLLTLSSINISIEGNSQIIDSNSKYENKEFLKLFKIPYSSIKAFRAPINNDLIKAYEEHPNTFWASTTQIGTSLISVTIIFKQPTFINGFIYESYSEGTLGIGYPKQMKIYFYEKDNTNSNPSFNLLDDITSTTTNKKVLFTFSKTIKCYQLKLEWAQIFSHSGIYINKATIKELSLLFPEGKYLNSEILNVYDKSDYKQLTLISKYNTKNMIDSINSELNQYGFNENTKKYIKRITSIFNGSLKYDQKREFSTNSKSNVNIIEQNGDIQKYAKNILKLHTAGTNWQVMGIYGRGNEEITVYVKLGKTNDPLPSIIPTQFIGTKWLGTIQKLKEGKQSFIFDNFNITIEEGYTNFNDPRFSTFSGGPMYLINPFTSEEQSQNISIYVEGGEVFPVFKLGGDEKQYINDLSECIELNKKNNLTYFDITELVGLRSIMTFRASQSYNIYSQKDSIGPQKNLLSWDQYLKDLYSFSGIIFTRSSPYYDKKNLYIKVHFKWSQYKKGIQAFNAVENIGITHDSEMIRLLNYNIDIMGIILPHEIGHAIEIEERYVTETTNNMLRMYSRVKLEGKYNVTETKSIINKMKYLPPDVSNELLRACNSTDQTKCRGYYANMLNVARYNLWWDLECNNYGYWAELNNLYRYNNSLVPSNLSKEEKMVYFSNLVFKMDIGYYFTRVGLTFNKGITVFNENNVSSTYKNLMKKAESDGLIDKNEIKKKFWYLNDKAYEFNLFNYCYSDKTKYNVQIINVIKESDGYKIVLPEINCEGHLGFEIIESNKIIGFTYENYYKDTNSYKTGYNPQYKIIAYDYRLYASNESNIKSAKSNLLKFK